MKIIHNQRTYDPAVATIGFFDGVHCGHRFLIDQVCKIAAVKGMSSAVITFTEHPRMVINSSYIPALLSTLQEKLTLLEQMGIDTCFLLDFTLEMASLTARQFMEQVLRDRFNIKELVIGYDHRFGHNREETFEDYQRYGAELGIIVIEAEAYKTSGLAVSSSVVRMLLQTAHLDEATRYLGHTYRLSGIVVKGHQIGKTIGFPTANIQTEDVNKLIPSDGVYVVNVVIDGQMKRGMLNIGNRPTIGNGKDKSIEVNIFNFSQDIYGHAIQVEFLHYLRPQCKFDSVDQLVGQLQQDKVAAENFSNLSLNI
jgi:riboflavin kinase / FMN adenylyltransferase